MLSPWLLTKGLAMIYARRGTGKTYLALSIGYAVASGGSVLGWDAPKPRKVLYVDGEMLAAPLQERLATIVKGSPSEPQPGTFTIVTPDFQPWGMPDLATLGGQAALSEVMPSDTELIIVDSLSSLVRGEGRENDAESWLPIAQWALAQRVAGRSVLFLHHTNRRGEQRGTSKKEDALDTVLALRQPAEYEANKEARFEVHMEKSRTLCGNFTPLEAELITSADGGVTWTWKALRQTQAERMLQMEKDGMSKREIAEELHVNRSTVYRALARAQDGES
jgi:RecA-family ATPase